MKPPGEDPPPPPPVVYEIVWLPGLDSDHPATGASDINILGTIVGDADGKPVLWQAPGFLCQDLHVLWQEDIPEGYTLITARCISNAGHIAGRLWDDNAVRRLYVYDPSAAAGQRIRVTAPVILSDRFFDMYDVNDSGTVVGWENSDVERTAFVWNSSQGGDTSHFHVFPGYAFTSINNSEEVTGIIFNQGKRSWSWKELGEVLRGPVDDLEMLGLVTTLRWPYGRPVINDHSTVVAEDSVGDKGFPLYKPFVLVPVPPSP